MVCLQLIFSGVPWAVWVGASWDGAPVSTVAPVRARRNRPHMGHTRSARNQHEPRQHPGPRPCTLALPWRRASVPPNCRAVVRRRTRRGGPVRDASPPSGLWGRHGHGPSAHTYSSTSFAGVTRVLSEMHCTTRRGVVQGVGARRVGSVRRVVQCRTRRRGPTRRGCTTRRTVSYKVSYSTNTVRHSTT